ncbi:MAG: isoprenylcysteine carboxylmethyltransferase family protein [Cypionkella sp.]
MSGAILLLSFVTLSRLGELVLARRNTKALLAQGAVEVAPGHYPLIVALHSLWLAALWIFGYANPLNLNWLAVFVLLQMARVWVLSTLGARWTTRIIVLPDAPLVRHGPFRFIPHPNYAVVIAEIAVLPLCLGLPWVALVFTLVNALVLTIRIRAETLGLSLAAPHVAG